jgi:phage baseplate assembly protein W
MPAQADPTEIAPFIGSGLSWPMRARPDTIRRRGNSRYSVSADSEALGANDSDWDAQARHLPLFELTSGHEELDQAIYAILSTAPGERVMRQDFGCKIWDLVFSPINDNTLGLVEYEVARALARWEPRIAVKSVSAARPERDRLAGSAPSNDHTIVVSISYSVKVTNDVRNLVYPFYVLAGEPT